MPLSPSSRPEQSEIETRLHAFRFQARAPLALPPCAAEAAAAVHAARRRAPLAGWPRRGAALAARILRTWRSRELGWRAKVLATPGLGALAGWAASLVRLGGFRRQTLTELARLTARMQQLELAAAQLAEREAALAERIAESLAPRREGQSLPPAVYLALEERLRGPSDAIGPRFAAYRPFVDGAVGLGLPAVDLGCGRGEWLEFLSAAGLSALGVDGNAAMVAACRTRGLAVEQGDGLAWLLARTPGSLGLVSLIHVAEHLPPEALFAWLRAAERALAPNGLLIVETPNPENLQVAAYSFWFDPTHLRPLPPPLLEALATAAGLRTIEILRLAPWPELAEDDALYPPYLRKLLFCGQDYGLVAQKPAGGGP